VGRREGDLRAARLGGSGVVIVVPAPGAPGALPDGEGGLSASGLYDGSGRLWQASAAPVFYRPILRRFEGATHLLVSDEAPDRAWPSFAAALAVGLLGLLAIVLGARAMLRARTRDPGA
jgi:hypothetical protein